MSYPKRLVLASSNPGKVKEIARLLAEFHIEVLLQSEFSVPDVEETGLSFVENAILKARNAAQYTGLPAIADDSGIEVDALNGRPGIYSARYAGLGVSDQDNNEKLLHELADVPEDMAHALDPTPVICQGTWEGRILFTPQGKGGFGYDPLFFVPTHECAAAELDPQEKNNISHRGQALRKLISALRGEFESH